MSQDKGLDVRLNGLLLGRLEQTVVGKMSFVYVDGAAHTISLSMPVRSEPYDDDACEAYFGGLLPESEKARVAIGRHYGANPNNNFSLLRAIGHDCAGALSLHAPNENVSEAATVPLAGRFPTEAELAIHLRELPKRPLMIGVDDIRLSLAGAQDKAALCMIGARLAFPALGVPTTHILKPAIAHVGETVVNEYLCMRLAAAVGLPVAAVEMHQAEDIPFLLVERFDRVIADGLIGRIHQEDFCQALGVRSPQKYERDGGPNLATCFALMKRLTFPAQARTQLLQTLIFNVLIGNGDAHAKNYSILHRSKGGVVLTPAYDLLSTRYYFTRRARMAMKLGGYYDFEKIQLRHWQRFSQNVGLAFPLVRKMLEDLEARLQEVIANEWTLYDAGEAHAVLDYLSCHARTMVAQARSGPPRS
jgi:serine/threonine-protein kinase HipA